MDQLAGFSEAARKLALDRSHLLQPHLEDKRPLKTVAANVGIPYRTAQRWVALYQEFGLAGLARRKERTPGRTGRFQPRSRRPSKESLCRSLRFQSQRFAAKFSD
jgi:putative transposase